MPQLRGILSAAFLTTVLASPALHAEPAAADGMALLPSPKSVKPAGGAMALTAKSGIIATDKSLEPLAAILAGEIEMLTGLKLSSDSRAPRAGDIVLKINPKLRAGEEILAVQKLDAKQAVVRTKDFAHGISITDTAVVEGWDYRAVCEGTATLLQAIGGKDGAFTLPKMAIEDWPFADYTGTTVDVARQAIPIDALKAVVQACRLNKVRYCLLHLSDDEAFTFPSTAFPKLGSSNTSMHGGVVPTVYALKDLRELVAYADARGVTLIPELATPNHSQAMCRDMPKWAGPKILNIVNPEVYKNLEVLVGEMCDVFKSSPYFHMGGEEAYFFEMEEWEPTKAYMQKKEMKAFAEVVLEHQARMIEIIRKHGKMPMAWEGGTVENEKQKDDIIIMSWIPYQTAGETQKKGFTTITVPWERGPALQKWNIFNCNGVTLTPANKVLGGSVTMWQMSAAALVGDFLGGKLNDASGEGYIRSMGDHMEGAWAPMANTSQDDLAKKTTSSRAKLESLLFPVRIVADSISFRAWPVVGSQTFAGSSNVKIGLADGVSGGEIRFTLDGSEPTAKSELASAPIVVEETTTVHAALFRGGKQVGAVTRAVFQQSAQDGSIAKWMVAGPYTQEGKNMSDLFNIAFDPETTGKAEWKSYAGAKVKFGEIPGMGGNDRVAYMKTQIFSTAAQKAKLVVGTDDGAKVFLNGKIVHEVNMARPSFNGDTIDVSLQEGWNQLLIKVTNGGEGWDGWTKVLAADGGKFQKLRIKAE